MQIIKKVVAVGDETIEPGDEFFFEMEDGEDVKAIALMDDGIGILCITEDCLKKEMPLHTHGDYTGWEECELRERLNGEVLARFPDGLRRRMIPFSNGDILRIPTEKEIFEENEYGEPEPETTLQLPRMDERRMRIAFQGWGTDRWEWYWLQNRSVYSASYACYVGTDGDADAGGASHSLGVRPLFRISNPEISRA